MIDFEHLANPEKYHTVPPRAEGEKDEQYKARLKAYVQGIKSQQAKIDELKKKLDCCREENKALLDKLNVPGGYKLVPVETTAKQNREGVKKFVRHRNENTWSCDAIDDIYKAMIGAADEIN